MNKWPKRIAFFIFLALIIGLLVGHPFVPFIVKKINRDAEINWTLYTMLVSIFIIAVFIPIVDKFSASDIEVELRSPNTDIEMFLARSAIEVDLVDMSKFKPARTPIISKEQKKDEENKERFKKTGLENFNY